MELRNQDLESILMENGIGTSFPIEKYLEAVDKTKFEEDKIEAPNGWRDSRGEEELYPFMEIHTGNEEFDIVFIGQGHIPYFHQRFRDSGLKPYIIAASQSIDVVDKPGEGVLLVLAYHRRYPIEDAKDGKPILIVGDHHGDKYNSPFPSPEKLKEAGISKVYFHAEDVPHHATEEERRSNLKHGFWGKRNLSNYLEELEKSGIHVHLNGL